MGGHPSTLKNSSEFPVQLADAIASSEVDAIISSEGNKIVTKSTSTKGSTRCDPLTDDTTLKSKKSTTTITTTDEEEEEAPEDNSSDNINTENDGKPVTTKDSGAHIKTIAEQIEVAENKCIGVAEVMKANSNDARIQSYCAICLAKLSAGNKANRNELNNLGCIELLLTAMKSHQTDEKLQYQAVSKISDSFI